MLISRELLIEINRIQTAMLAEVARVCEKLELRFFLVHGSMLGTVRNAGFVPGDDDIDIAMKRSDYERFLQEAPLHLPESYFIQTTSSDPAYPMEFAKIRDSSTTYVIDSTRRLKMNHGVYIDLFPIDHSMPQHSVGFIVASFRHRLLNLRISSLLDFHQSNPLKKAAGLMTKLLWPDVNRAILLRERLNRSERNKNWIRITGGKRSEQSIPAKWFAEAVPARFEGIKIYIPGCYDAYLTRIYGNYQNRTLLENKRSDDNSVEINACLVDTKTSYMELIQKWTEREKWKEFYEPWQIEKIHRLELMLLKDFDSVCAEHHLKYFVYGGTMIGAVKYRGFVPWDDDIDLAMPREDYEALAKLGSDAFPDRVVLQDPARDNKSPYLYLKLRLRDTKCVEYGFHRLKIEHGIYLDIYPIDKLPAEPSVLKKQFTRFQRLARIYVRRQCPYLTKSGSGLKYVVRSSLLKMTFVVLHLIPRRRLLHRLIRLSTQYNSGDSNIYGNYFNARPVNIFHEISPAVPGSFENIPVLLPADWEGFLRRRYGDYKSTPPNEKRVGHRPYVLDFGQYG